jgi:predicted nucleic acid-binding protein
MTFVLDASVALSWLLNDAGAGQAYATAALRSLEDPGAQALVPSIWGLELASVIAKAESAGRLPEARTTRYLATLSLLPIVTDRWTADHALRETLQIARRYGLSSYDAAYLELAQRLSLPLATLDDALRRAARKAGVQILSPR